MSLWPKGRRINWRSISGPQTMEKESSEWRRHVEANSSLRKRWDESHAELEKVMKVAQAALKEQGNAEELLKKHTVR